jgi:predicted GH43/DUF377 family glycosyl hydrolase
MMTRKILMRLLVACLLTACAPTPTHPPTPLPTVASPTATSQATLTPTLTHTPPPTQTVIPTLEPTRVPFFTVQGSDPVVPKGSPGSWDDRYTDPGAVFYHDGQFHMFRNGFRDWPATVQIGYATSPDGYTWTQQGDAPVLTTAEVPYAGVAALASSALVDDDGTWVLYFYTWQSKNYPSAGGIGRATASAPTGPWQVDPDLVLAPGSSSEWDGQHVLSPDVFKTDTGYTMYYSGYGRNGEQQIGMATSPDGIHWAKYNDPATTGAPYTESDPVLKSGNGGAWDSAMVHQPRVRPLGDGWVMFYRSEGGSDMALGYATSSDGIHWERYRANPILNAQAVKGGRTFWFTNVEYYDDTYFLYWEVEKSLTTQIYLATHTGRIP